MSWRYPIAAALMMLSATSVQGETWREVVNGGTCNPYPATGTNFAGVNYAFWLYGLRNSAFCHLSIPDGWDAKDLSYVVFTGTVSNGSGSMGIRVCTFGPTGLSTSCGSMVQMDPQSFPVKIVTPPAPGAGFVQGAYLHLTFPNGQVSTVQNIVPVLSR